MKKVICILILSCCIVISKFIVANLSALDCLAAAILSEEKIYKSILPVEKCFSMDELTVQESEFMGIKTKIVEYKTILNKNAVINQYSKLYERNFIKLPEQENIFQLQIETKNYILQLSQEKKFTIVKIIQMNSEQTAKSEKNFSNGFNDIPKFPNSTFEGYSTGPDGSITCFYRSNAFVEEHKKYFEKILTKYNWQINNEIQKLLPETISNNFLCRIKNSSYCVIQFYSDEKGYTTTVIVRGKIKQEKLK